MGIRFFCPKGHKLNVKNFLAGKAGFCPHCGTKVLVPHESTRGSRREPAAAVAGQGDSDSPGTEATARQAPPTHGHGDPHSTLSDNGPAATYYTSDTGSPSPFTTMVPPEMSVAEAGAVEPATALPREPAPQPMAGPPPLPHEPPQKTDPLAENPNAVWYVRPAGVDQQYGPAGADLMRSWMAEGRVAPDALVWRDGWPEWQEAGAVFPQLGTEEDSQPAPTVAVSPHQPADPARTAPRRRTPKATIALVIGLLAVVAVLLAVLLVVLFRTA